MCVYNGQDHVAAAIDSILTQSFNDFELVVVDDGSTDDTAQILSTYAAQDQRVRVHTQENTGLTRALNVGLSLCTAPLIARQDADDLSYTDRLQRQFDLFQNRSDVVLCGSDADIQNEDHISRWGHYEEADLPKIVRLRPPFPHSSAMFKKETAQALGGYDETYSTAQDMEFWMRMAQAGKLAMIADPLIRLNVGAGTISRKRLWRQHYDAFRARWAHNRGIGRLTSFLHGLRTLLIALVPLGCLKAIKRRRA